MEFEAVLSLDVHIKATVLPVYFSLVEESSVVQHPLGLVELGRGSGPVLVMGLEPDGPFTRVLAGQQLGQPGGPDVGVFAALGQGLFTGSGLVSVLFSPVYFGVRRAHKGAPVIKWWTRVRRWRTAVERYG